MDDPITRHELRLDGTSWWRACLDIGTTDVFLRLVRVSSHSKITDIERPLYVAIQPMKSRIEVPWSGRDAITLFDNRYSCLDRLGNSRFVNIEVFMPVFLETDGLDFGSRWVVERGWRIDADDPAPRPQQDQIHYVGNKAWTLHVPTCILVPAVELPRWRPVFDRTTKMHPLFARFRPVTVPLRAAFEREWTGIMPSECMERAHDVESYSCDGFVREVWLCNGRAGRPVLVTVAYSIDGEWFGTELALLPPGRAVSLGRGGTHVAAACEVGETMSYIRFVHPPLVAVPVDTVSCVDFVARFGDPGQQRFTEENLNGKGLIEVSNRATLEPYGDWKRKPLDGYDDPGTIMSCRGIVTALRQDPSFPVPWIVEVGGLDMFCQGDTAAEAFHDAIDRISSVFVHMDDFRRRQYTRLLRLAAEAGPPSPEGTLAKHEEVDALTHRLRHCRAPDEPEDLEALLDKAVALDDTQILCDATWPREGDVGTSARQFTGLCDTDMIVVHTGSL